MPAGIGPSRCLLRCHPRSGSALETAEGFQYNYELNASEAGGVNYELLMPVSGDTIYEEHLREHGDGYHHACVLYSTLDAMRTAGQQLLVQGRELLQGGSVGEAVESCYFAIPEIGSALELLYLEDLQEPEKTIG